MRNLDTVTLELIKGAIQSARVEMEALIERSAMSPFIREKKDYFTAFFDRDGRLVVSTALPMAAGNLIDCIFERYPRDDMRPGDLYLYNDSYGSHGAVSHNNDMVFVAPVFSDARIVAFAEAWGHLWDIGGMVPGSISPAATDVFQEGIVIPPSRVLRDGIWNEELIRTFVRNTRFPDMVRGDLSAIMAAVRLGGRRMEEIAERFGAGAVEAAFAGMLDQSERALRKAFAERVPDGRYSFRDYIDSDSVSEKSYAVAVTVEKRGETIALDYSASDDQAQGAINFIMDSSVPKTMCGLYFTGQEAGVALNGGFHRAVGEVKTRPGSIVSPREPAPLGMRSHCLTRVNSSLFGAFAKATGGNVPAASSVYVLYYLRSWNKERTELDLCIEGLAVGFGARPHADGIDAVYYVAQKNYPIEFAEMEFGVRVEGYAMHADSGGPGFHRGGCGIVRDLRVVGDEAVIGLRMDNMRWPAWGVKGGMGGGAGRIVVNPGMADERELRPMSEGNKLKKGDLVRIMTPGGGGWGSPLERAAEQVRDDVLDGFISAESAARDYGVVLSSDLTDVDAAATDARRKELARMPRGLFHRHSYFDDEELPRAAE
ncbi:MAG: hydantoinase B/oxoprolinase family protein [Xanthobacteraceae bacterium]|nr:hydantoinase B/oxoprolinase family protein [Xanthobacteraceae bacterium]